MPAGCFRSRMLNPPKTRPCPPGSASCNPIAPAGDAGSVNRDAAADGRIGDALPADGARDSSADAPLDGLRDSTPDTRDGGDAVASDLPSDSRTDGSRDGVLDGISDSTADSVRDVRLDGASDRGSDIVVCGTIEICGNGIDDDCNGLADCFDRACQGNPACIDHKKEVCDNGKDDDGNGLVDCKDPACFGDKTCAVPGVEICNNNLDDDEDGLIDCKDPDCAKDPSCVVSPGKEICDNGKDDNGDGLTDCTDPQCKTFPACLQSACVPDVDLGAIASSGASVSKTISTVGATASFSVCVPGGVARVASFSLAAAADVRMDFTQDKGSAHVVALFSAGVGQTCDANPVNKGCLNVGQKATDTTTYNALPPGNYWLVIQSYSGTTTGSATVTLSTGKPGTTEICDNGKDDDGDGAIDCADLDCATAANCNLCVPDINLGAIVVGGGSQSIIVDTTTGRPSQSLSCLKSDGKAVVVGFSLKQTVSLNLSWQEQSGGDHGYGIYEMPRRGDSCESVRKACVDLMGTSESHSWDYFPAGDYVLILKAEKAGAEGKISVALSASLNPGIEFCGNGIDDDGDGLVDCDDPDCYGVGSCQAPMCVPYADLGTFDVGTTKPLQVDLSGATDVYSNLGRCAVGNGVGRAYRMTLSSAMELDVSWTQTGSNVLAMSPQVAPLDRCDTHIPESNQCLALVPPYPPTTFGWGRFQPGTYYLLVAGVAKGTEGTVDLTLSGVYQNILEICNNGIDDDGDGATDCDDEKCTTDASCVALRCRLDEDLGLLAIDGSTSTAVLDTSNNAGDDQHKCASGSGGADAVVGFTLPGTTDLSVTWTQRGNHALGLYKVDNKRLPCEANTPVDCRPTNDVFSGSYTLPSLAAGSYYLVVDAENASSEGGVILQLSGLPSK
jgi:hypothetical protein